MNNTKIYLDEALRYLILDLGEKNPKLEEIERLAALFEKQDLQETIANFG